MILFITFGFMFLVAMQMSEDKYHAQKRADRAKRMQKRIAEARKGYRHLN